MKYYAICANRYEELEVQIYWTRLDLELAIGTGEVTSSYKIFAVEKEYEV